MLRRHTNAGIGDGDGDPIVAVFLPMPRINADRAALREFIRVAHEVEKSLPQPHGVSVQRPDCAIATDRHAVLVLGRKRLNGLDHAVDERRKREIFQLQLHAASLDLGEIEDVVDQREQMPAGAEHPVERLEVLLCCFGILPQHLAHADDGVERRAQLVTHVGQELRLVLARCCELASFLLNLMEQPRVLDRQHRLVGEGLQELDRAPRELAGLLAPHHQRADDPIGPQHRHNQKRPVSGALDDI